MKRVKANVSLTEIDWAIARLERGDSGPVVTWLRAIRKWRTS